MTLISTACSWVNMFGGHKAAIFTQVGQFYFGTLGQFSIGVDSAHYGQIRALLEEKGTLIGPNDLHIAAHARSRGMTLVSNNLREFKRVPGLLQENWIM